MEVYAQNGLKVFKLENRQKLGEAAAKDAAEKINKVISEKGEATVIFAAAPSQNETLAELIKLDVDWTKVRAFHMDEYIGLPSDHEAGFGNFLRRDIFDRVPFKEVYYLSEAGDTPEELCENYSKLLEEYKPDVIMLGIGENGHLAFNDPAVADFNDPKKVKVVELDDICRNQQVNDGCFASIDEVPKTAVTLTMSTIINVPYAITAVPTAFKADAIKNTIYGPISTACPASILREHPCATIYIDEDSASKAFA